MKILNQELKNKLINIGCFENDSDEDITYSYAVNYLLEHYNKFITVLPSLDNTNKFVYFVKDVTDINNEDDYNDFISPKEYSSVYEAYDVAFFKILEKLYKSEETVSITYSLIKNTCGWSKFCDVTDHNHYAINEFGHPNDNQIYEIKLSHAKKLNFI